MFCRLNDIFLLQIDSMLFTMELKKLLSYLLDRIQKICSILCGICLISISTVMLLAVLFRYVLVSPIVWSEEITGFLLVWMVLLAAPIGYRLKEHVAIDFLPKKLPAPVKPYLQLVHSLIILWVASVIVFYGIPHTIKSMNQIFPTLEWIRYGYMYGALPLGYFLLGLYCLEEIVLVLLTFKGKRG